MNNYLITFGFMSFLLGSSSVHGEQDSLGVQPAKKSVAMESREGVGIHSQPFFTISLINGDSLTVVITQESQPVNVKELYLSAVNVRNHQSLQIPWNDIVSIQRFDPRNVRELTNSIAGLHSDHFLPCGSPGLCDEPRAHVCCTGDTVLGIVLPSGYLNDGFATFDISDDSFAQLESLDMELLIDQLAFEACLDNMPSSWLAFEDALVPTDIVFEDDTFVGVESVARNDAVNEYHVGQLIKRTESMEGLNMSHLGSLLAADDSGSFDFDLGNDQDIGDDADEESTDEFVFIASSAKQPDDHLIAINDDAHRDISPALFKEIATLLLEEDNDPAFLKQKSQSLEIRLQPAFYIGNELIDNAVYEKFTNATGYPKPAYWTNGQIPAGAAKEGVKNLTLDDAHAFIRWRNKQVNS